MYVGIKRDWSKCTKVLFVRKVTLVATDDVFIGSGLIDKIIIADRIRDPKEKKLYLENNWYGKLIFSKLLRFVPIVPILDTPVAGQNPLLLHGTTISMTNILEIEKLARSKLILA